METSHDELTLYGVIDGKAVGTYLEHKFTSFLAEKYDYEQGNSASGIDLPGLDLYPASDLKSAHHLMKDRESAKTLLDEFTESNSFKTEFGHFDLNFIFGHRFCTRHLLRVSCSNK